MERVLEAVYENGVFTPLEILDLPERQRVTIIIHIPAAEGPDEALEAWQRVYDGLSDQDIAEIERITLDRSHFCPHIPLPQAPLTLTCTLCFRSNL